MRHQTSLALFGALNAVTVTAASLPRGVGPEFASFYKSKDNFACITNTAIRIPLDKVNDNSCDCPDGSDEPGTAACAFIDPLSPEQPLVGSSTGTTNTTHALPGFWCKNKGHIGMYVPFMYVNDGVCDYELCCDGSEEYKGVGGVKCENKCSQIGKEYRKLQDEKRRKTESAEKKRKSMIDEAAELRRKAETKVVELRAEIAQLETKKADLEKKKVEVERQERGKVVQGEGAGGPLGVLVGLTKTRISELRQTLESVINQRNDLRTKVEELETILRNFKAEYNPNFNDEGVKAAVKSFEDYASREVSSGIEDVPDEEVQTILKEDDENNGVNWKEFETDNKDDTDILYSLEAYLPGFLRTVIHDQLESIRVWLIQNGILADSGPGKESHLIKAARDAVSAVEKDLKGKKTDLDKANEELSADYGSNDIFRSLKGKCVSTDSGEYTYELCWLDKTSQKSKKGHGNTSMGHFKRIDREMADEEEKMNGKSLGSGMRMVLKYEDGQQCWNGPRRRTDVWLGCAETEELWRISESEKCVYRMEVGTPAACEKEDVVQRAKGKDEL